MVDNISNHIAAVRLDSLILWDSVEEVLPGLLAQLGIRDSVLVVSRSALSSSLGIAITAYVSRVVTVAGSDATPAMAEQVGAAGGDGYLVFGGGTPIVAARAAAMDRPFPAIVIPTTPTTAIAAAGAALRDGDRRIERFDPASRPAGVIVDMLALEGAPDDVVHDAALVTWCSAVWQLQGMTEQPALPGPALRAARLVQEARDNRQALVVAALLSNSAGTPRAAGPAMALAHAIRLVKPDARLGQLMLPLTLATFEQGWGIEVRVVAAIGQSLQVAAAGLGSPGRLREVTTPVDFHDVAARALPSALLHRYPTCDTPALFAILENAW